jgi:hypothetical protein
MKLLQPEIFKKELEVEKGSPHQAILNVAYSHWQEKGNEDWDYGDMVENTFEKYGDVAAFAVMLGKYNQQVTNGGHMQYYDNGYASGSHKDLQPIDLHTDMMDSIKESGLSKNTLGSEVYSIMEEFADAIREPEEDEFKKECDDCQGSGKVTGLCPTCKGAGTVDAEEEGQEALDCPDCDGSGEGEEEICDKCGGEGYCEKETRGNLSEETYGAWEKLDTRYYAIDDRWMDLLGTYFGEWIEKGKDPLKENKKVEVKKESHSEEVESSDYALGKKEFLSYLKGKTRYEDLVDVLKMAVEEGASRSYFDGARVSLGQFGWHLSGSPERGFILKKDLYTGRGFGESKEVEVKNEATTKLGSATIENLEDTDYRVGSSTALGYVLIDKETGAQELWAVHSQPISGYNIKYGKRYLEFVRDYKADGWSKREADIKKEAISCPDCDGEGKVEYIGKSNYGPSECETCNGSGRLEEPGEDDIQTEDWMTYYQYGKVWLQISQDQYDEMSSEELYQMIKNKMEKENFFPDLFFISDHGNANLVDLNKP